MPRNVRPSWIEVKADEREIATGPKNRDGQMTATVYVRQNGDVHEALEIKAVGSSDVTKVRLVVTAGSEVIYEYQFNQ